MANYYNNRNNNQREHSDRFQQNRPNPPQKNHFKHLSNPGWFFYRYYYQELEDFKEKNKAMEKFLLTKNTLKPIAPIQNQQFVLKVVYPGLLIGSGSAHETGGDGESKLGFSFDYTTGLPLIPGSSIKGLLRSAFPNSIKKKRKKEEEDNLNETYRKSRREYIKECLGSASDIDIDALEFEIFEGVVDGKSIPVYQRDIFFDAYPSVNESKEESIRLFGCDYITPHSNPLKNPIPVQFLKIMPEVVFRFNFDLKDGLIAAGQKKKLFEKILLDFGIGAKTNVGYGQFTKAT